MVTDSLVIVPSHDPHLLPTTEISEAIRLRSRRLLPSLV